MRKWIMLAVSCPLFAQTDFAPHNLGHNHPNPPQMSADNAPSPYVASATSFFTGFNAFHGFDNDETGTKYWVSNGSVPQFLKLDYGSGNAFIVGAYEIWVNQVPEPNRAPNTWTLQGSNDDISYTTISTVSSQSSWTSSQGRTFECSDTSTAYRYFKLNITANNGDSLVQVAEAYYTALAGGVYVTTAQSEFQGAQAYRAFDGDVVEGFTWMGVNGGVEYLRIDLGATHAMGSYQVKMGNDSLFAANRCPKNWTMQGSNDGITFTTVDTQTNQTSWSAGEIRTYTLSSASAAYRWFQLNITANNGDATNTEVGELYLFSPSPAVTTATVDVQ